MRIAEAGLVALVCVLQAAAVLGAEDKNAAVSSSITEVTVYEDRALVCREAQIALEPGEREVLFAGLPATMMDDSLRAAGKGSARVTILGLEVEREYLGEAKDERVRELEEEIERMEDEDRLLQDRASAAKLQMQFIESIKSSLGEGISREMLLRPPDPKEWKEVVGFLGSEYQAVSPVLRAVQKERRELKRRIEAAGRKLKQIISALPREQKNVRVALDAAEGGDFRLRLSYMVGGASWQPRYDARADRGKGSVELVYGGQVRQNTGEDWDDVSLVLSTARPSVGGRPPELWPWYIGFRRYRRVAAKEKRGAGMILAERAPRAPAAAPPGEREADVATAEVGRRGEAITFRIRKKQTIPSDNNLHKTVIAPFAMPAEYGYFSVPKLAEYAYLRAKVTNTADYPLLAGRVDVFYGTEYVGTSSLDYVAQGEKFDLYLGVDEGVKVERTLLREEAERSLVRRRTGWKSFRYRIDVENHKEGEIEVTVLDQIPVSKQPDITVSLEAATPSPVTIPEWEKPGFLTWVLEVPPGGKKTIEYEFSVSYPKEKEIEGL